MDDSVGAESGGICVVFRVWMGSFVGGFATQIVGRNDHEVLGALVVRELLRRLKVQRRQNVVIQSDSATVVSAINSITDSISS